MKQAAQTETDFAFVNRLAARNGGVFYVEPTPIPGVSKAAWGPESRLGTPQPALTMNFQSGSTVCNLRFHLDALAPLDVSLPTSLSQLDLGDLAPSIPQLSLPLATSPQAALRKRMARDTAKMSTARAQARLAAAKAASLDAVVAEW